MSPARFATGSSKSGVKTTGGAQPHSVRVISTIMIPIQKLGIARPPMLNTRIA